MATGILEWMVETAFLLSFFLVWLYAETLLDIYPYGVWRGVFFSFSVLVSPKMVCLLGGERESERKKKCRIGVR